MATSKNSYSKVREVRYVVIPKKYSEKFKNLYDQIKEATGEPKLSPDKVLLFALANCPDQYDHEKHAEALDTSAERYEKRMEKIFSFCARLHKVLAEIEQNGGIDQEELGKFGALILNQENIDLYGYKAELEDGVVFVDQVPSKIAMYDHAEKVEAEKFGIDLSPKKPPAKKRTTKKRVVKKRVAKKVGE